LAEPDWKQSAAISRSMDDCRWASAASMRRDTQGSCSMARKTASRPMASATTGETVSTDET
jgi:hypothetical protein